MEQVTSAPQIQLRKIPLIPFRVSAVCDCGGEYIFDDAPVALHPRLFKHRCNKCGAELFFQESFPKTIYEELTGESDE